MASKPLCSFGLTKSYLECSVYKEFFVKYPYNLSMPVRVTLVSSLHLFSCFWVLRIAVWYRYDLRIRIVVLLFPFERHSGSNSDQDVFQQHLEHCAGRI